MRLTDEVIETIERQDLRTVIESHGLKLKKKGGNSTRPELKSVTFFDEIVK